MSLFQSLEVDTLRLRNLIVRTTDNIAFPRDYQIFSKGDGGTYWAKGVLEQEFKSLSSLVTSNTSTFSSIIVATQSSFEGNTSTLQEELYSTLYGFSSFSQNLSSYSACIAYTDGVISNYSTIMDNTLKGTYVTIDVINNSLESLEKKESSDISTLSSVVYILQTDVSLLSSYTISSFVGFSTYTHSTFRGVFKIESTNFRILLAEINVRSDFLQGNIKILSTKVCTELEIQGDKIESLYSITNELSSNIYIGDSTIYRSSIKYTDSKISTLNSNLSTTFIEYGKEIKKEILYNNSTIDGKIVSTSKSLTSSINILSTNIYIAYSTLAYDINFLSTTGLIANIYATFIELEQYSVGIINSTISTANAVFTSTNKGIIVIGVSSFNAATRSSIEWVEKSVYSSTISTVENTIFSTINYKFSTTVKYFNSTVSTSIIYFDNKISTILSGTYSTISLMLSSVIITGSTISGKGISTQIGIYSTTISSVGGIIDEAYKYNVYPLSTAFYSQFLTAPSIIMHRNMKISTLDNVSSVIALSTLNVSNVFLNTANYNNFYILISDISNDVYYGVTYSTNNKFINQDFTIQVDIKSANANKYFILDTTNMASWFKTPVIYNPNSYEINSHFPLIPNPSTTPQIYLSSFLGAYIINMRLTPLGMFLKTIYSYPYIYTTLTFGSFGFFPSNVLLNTTPANISNLLATSTFVYRGSKVRASWETNDTNIPLGFKFIGRSPLGRTITTWSGPYNSGLTSVDIVIPPSQSAFVTYTTMYIAPYPNTINKNNTTDGNISAPGKVFATVDLSSKPLCVVTPTLNTRVTVLNPNTIETNNLYLQVAEIRVNNELREDIITQKPGVYTKHSYDGSFPFEGVEGFDAKNAFDNDPNTYFFGGITANAPDPNAFVRVGLSTLNRDYNSSVYISSIDVSGTNYASGLEGMQLKLESWNEPGIEDGFFYSTMTLTRSTLQTFCIS